MNETTTVTVAGYGTVVLRKLGLIELQKSRERHYIESAVNLIKISGEVAYPGDSPLQARHLKDGLLALPKGPALQREIDQQQLDDLYLARLMVISATIKHDEAVKILADATEVEVVEILRAIHGTAEKKTSPSVTP